MIQPDLLIENLRVVAGGRTILQVDRLAVAPGEMLGVLGPNGAGKTTLLAVCLGFRRPTAGRVVLLGQEVARLGSRALAALRCHVGYIPQQLAGHSQMPLTVREVVAIGRTGLAGLLQPLTANDWRLTDEAIDRLGLAALRNEPYAHLSGGEQRKTLLARALVQQPRILMLDEPTTHLDLGWREHIVTTLDELCAAERPTVILVCHELEVLPKSCRRLVLLRDGQVRAQGTPEEVLTPACVADLYGPGLRVWHADGRHAVVPFSTGDV